jgi:ABC-type dipeptide/oligopeptide/nickel transport system ATPase subunit
MISNEQSNIIQYMSSNESDDKIVTINAVSGSGKSSVSK